MRREDWIKLIITFLLGGIVGYYIGRGVIQLPHFLGDVPPYGNNNTTYA